MKLNEDFWDNQDDIDTQKQPVIDIPVVKTDFEYICSFYNSVPTETINREILKVTRYIRNATCFSFQDINSIELFYNSSQAKKLDTANIITNIAGKQFNNTDSSSLAYYLNIVLCVRFSGDLKFSSPRELWNFFHIFAIPEKDHNNENEFKKLKVIPTI